MSSIRNDIFKKLGSRIVSNQEQTRIEETIKDNYNITGDVSFYTPVLNNFSNYFTKDISLNNEDRLYKLIKKKERISIIGYFYTALIKNKSNRTFYKNIFMKEIPILSVENVDLYSNKFNYMINPISKKLCDTIYANNSATNVEILVNYLVSKLVELDISPTFCKFYGVYSLIFDKFTYDMNDSPELVASMDRLMESENPPKYIIHKKTGDQFLEYRDIPGYLLATENGGHDYGFIQNNVSYNYLLSITFQAFTAIINMYNVFGIKHNDLHFGNVMFKETEKEFIYYRLGEQCFRVPTYGYIIKIIDWGRATYNFNDFIGDSQIYNYDSECFGQYVYKRMNNHGKRKLVQTTDNPWTDIIMLSYSILHENRSLTKTQLGKMLKKIITSKNGVEIDISNFSWNIYRSITNREYNIKINNIILNKVFPYKYNGDIPNDEIVYKIIID